MEISCKSLSDILTKNKHDYYLLDVREEKEFAICRIANSKNVPMGQLPSEVESLAELEKKVVAICHHGVRSLRAAVWLRQNGVEAYSLKGGVEDWANTIDSTMPKY